MDLNILNSEEEEELPLPPNFIKTSLIVGKTKTRSMSYDLGPFQHVKVIKISPLQITTVQSPFVFSVLL